MMRTWLLAAMTACWLAGGMTWARAEEAPGYNPVVVLGKEPIKSIELTLKDAARGRDIPLRVYMPSSRKPEPVVIFSHGLGGSRDASKYLGNHLAARGYLAVFLQHPGSDEEIWKNAKLLNRISAMKQAASTENLVARCEDVKALIDQLAIWSAEANHPLFERASLDRIGMSGHSFGAHTTQAVAGQSFPLVGQKFLDQRIDAAIAYSPSSPAGGNNATPFGKVRVPWMLMTGTNDIAPIGGQTVQQRLAVYPNLPASIDKYELVLFGAEHSVFSDRGLRAADQGPAPKHHQAILALSTAFWDCYLRDDANARKWLTSDRAKDVLDAKDRWQHSP